jgi:hypothetical protein
MLEKFTYQEYEALLLKLKSDHIFLCFSDFRKKVRLKRYLILRHDIDFSLSYAMKMAHLESAIGIKATYFLLLSSKNYNLFSKSDCSIPKKLISLGHEVGLHYDPKVMEERNPTDLTSQIYYETRILSEISRKPIKSIAMHNPSLYGKDPFADDKNFINAYGPQFTKEIPYFSDSCGAWRDSTYIVFNQSPFPDKLQLLIHPIFWSEENGDRWDRLTKWMMENHQFLEYQYDQVKLICENHTGVKEQNKRNEKMGR